MLDIDLSVFTNLKKERNIRKSQGGASYNELFTGYDDNRPGNKVSVMGNPTIGDVKVMMLGVRNLSGEVKSGEVWVNELRLLEPDSDGGWAASGTLEGATLRLRLRQRDGPLRQRRLWRSGGRHPAA